MKKLKVVDLFSGLGGASQAFLDRGHEVIRYDFDESFKDIPFTIIADIWDLTEKDLKGKSLIWASPPCNHFSIASVYRHWKGGIPTKETIKQIDLVFHTIDIIKKANPKYWILENPRGMLRTVIGKPAITQYWGSWGLNVLKPTDLWGKLPPIEWRTKETAYYEKAPRGSKLGIQGIRPGGMKKDFFGYTMARSPALRAIIPYEFSLALCLAVEGKSKQQTLESYS